MRGDWARSSPVSRNDLADAPMGTRLINSVELEPPVPLGPLGGLLGRRIQGSAAENLRVLKDVLEERI